LCTVLHLFLIREICGYQVNLMLIYFLKLPWIFAICAVTTHLVWKNS